MTQLQIPQRFPLDNAAQIFVNIVSKGETTLSRIGLVMSEPVDRERLQQAITNIIPVRFPYFQVYLKKTFFAYVLERTDDIPQVEDDSFYTGKKSHKQGADGNQAGENARTGPAGAHR